MRLLILDRITTGTLLKEFTQLKVKPLSLQEAKNIAYNSNCESNSSYLCELLNISVYTYDPVPQWDGECKILLGALGSWRLLVKNVTIDLVDYQTASGTTYIYTYLQELEKGSTIIIRGSQLTSEMVHYIDDFDFLVRRFLPSGKFYDTKLELCNIGSKEFIE